MQLSLVVHPEMMDPEKFGIAVARNVRCLPGRRGEDNEPSLWVETGTPHCGEAFATCQWSIDKTKRVVPIRKIPIVRTSLRHRVVNAHVIHLEIIRQFRGTDVAAPVANLFGQLQVFGRL